MAFASVGTLGSIVTPKSAGTTSVITVSADANVGNLVAVGSAWDNAGTTDAETSQLSIADSAGNTWTKVAEYTRSAGAANDGVTVGLWVSVITSQLTSGAGTITVTSSSSRTAKASAAWEYSLAESSVAVEDYEVNGIDVGDPPSIALAGMASREYLLLHVGGEGRGSTWTADGDYTARHDVETTGGGSATNVNLFMADRIATLTGDTVDAASNTDTIIGQIIAAIYEVAGGDVTALPDTGIVTLSGVVPTALVAIPAPAAAVLTLLGNAPTAAVAAAPTPGVIALTGNAPTARVVVTPSPGVLELSGFAPTFDAGADETIAEPDTGTLTLLGNAPTAITSVTADPATLTLVGFAPTPTITAAPSPAIVTATGNAPTVIVSTSPAGAEMSLLGFSPTFTGEVVPAAITFFFDQPTPNGGADAGTPAAAVYSTPTPSGGVDEGTPSAGRYDEPTPGLVRV